MNNCSECRAAAVSPFLQVGAIARTSRVGYLDGNALAGGNRMKWRILAVSALAILASGSFAHPEPPPRSERAPPSAGPGTGPAPFWATGWKPGYAVPSAWTPRYFHYETRYAAVVETDELIFETFADGTASWIARALPQDLLAKPDECLNWRWSADTLPSLTEREDTLTGDFRGAGLCVRRIRGRRTVRLQLRLDHAEDARRLLEKPLVRQQADGAAARQERVTGSGR